jgi:hypothetical protein
MKVLFVVVPLNIAIPILIGLAVAGYYMAG